MTKKKMICPRCGAEMNHHAMKIDYSQPPDDSYAGAFEGLLEEVHSCPNCHLTEFLPGEEK
jgi:ribosomal protein S27AE